MGMHCATDTFGQHRKQGPEDAYIKMIGGALQRLGRTPDAGIRRSADAFELRDAFERMLSQRAAVAIAGTVRQGATERARAHFKALETLGPRVSARCRRRGAGSLCWYR